MTTTTTTACKRQSNMTRKTEPWNPLFFRYLHHDDSQQQMKKKKNTATQHLAATTTICASQKKKAMADVTWDAVRGDFEHGRFESLKNIAANGSRNLEESTSSIHSGTLFPFLEISCKPTKELKIGGQPSWTARSCRRLSDRAIPIIVFD
jgi:hypothetical protein